jgi:hypothetical protein
MYVNSYGRDLILFTEINWSGQELARNGLNPVDCVKPPRDILLEYGLCLPALYPARRGTRYRASPAPC